MSNSSETNERAVAMEKLRVYKQVCLKIRSTLVSGREDLVSPTLVTRNFVEGFAATLNDRLLSEQAMDRCDHRSVYSPTCTPTDSFGNGASAKSVHDCTNGSGVECPFIEEAEGWSIEYNEVVCEMCGSDAMCGCPGNAMQQTNDLPLRKMDEKAYRDHFYGKQHWNYFTDEPDIGPLVLSVKQEPGGESFRVLVRSSDHYYHGLIPVSQLDLAELNKDEVVNAIGRAMNLRTTFKSAILPNLEEELLKTDETFIKDRHKVGLVRVKAGQTNEEDIFSNQHESGPFDEFLNVLGDRVKLLGFQKFLGGLDKDHDLTGKESLYTEFNDLEVMFHVATLMPFTDYDPQQVNKKRHIGNDIVCVAFLDNTQAKFNPTWIRSHFIHSYIVVQHITGLHGQPLHRIAVTSRSSVPTFTPHLRHIPYLPHCTSLRSVILTKIVNAERACYHAPKFLKLTNRSRAQLLMELVNSLTEHSMAAKSGRATRKLTKRGNWLPIGASRPPSPLIDPVREKYTNQDKLVEDFKLTFLGPDLADVVFLVGEERIPVYAIKAILACRSKVFRTMFKEGTSIVQRLSSPIGRRRLNSSGSRLTNSTSASSPQLVRKMNKMQLQPSPQRSKLISSVAIPKKKKQTVSPDSVDRSDSVSPEPRVTASPFFDEPKQPINEQYYIDEFDEIVFSELLSYLMTGSCVIKPSTIVGITCAAEHFEISELKQACFDRLSSCLKAKSVCLILTQLEKYLSYHSAKTMVVRALEFVDSNAADVLTCSDFLYLSENMVYLILRRDIEVDEILKVNAALDWGRANLKKGENFKKMVTPLVKQVRLHLIDPSDLMKIVVPSGLFENDQVMRALAYQVDPDSVETKGDTMFKPRNKGSVLSSR